MRSSRLAVMTGLVVIVVLAAGSRFSASPQPARVRPPAIALDRVALPIPVPKALGRVQIPGTLRQALARLLALDSLGRRAPRPPLPSVIQQVGPLWGPGPPISHAVPCNIAGDGCSLIPCVEFARITNATAMVHAGAATIGSRCRGRRGAPKILRVAAG
jgi:hypothetical protein